jgi:hypothetical protein
VGRARTIYDTLMADVGVGELISYEAAGQALGLDPVADRTIIQQAARQAGKWLLEEQQRAIDVVPGVGYRVVQASEHLTLARRHQRKSQRALRRGRASLDHVRRDELDAFQLRLVDSAVVQTQLQLEMYTRFKRDQKRLEKGLEVQADRSDRTEAQVKVLHDRIARLEANLAPNPDAS